ncbi:Aspartyl-tRNA(Asn) amidotransferase subunit C (EC 6.3.5.6) @ Glutamyl-tRNA(Gln) amidotransferase subunit C (EC 6.3.5.7) [uncultured Gammaproteobacteria bacterium]|jgi:aspartyl-tRNA(Asn)/glutamyl-tRNA(Gln) amidotransferase subunit C|uniref:Asp-tRNA(Asn)/Glu-tRNA(Gln) amidotransferase subunit GatC n=1 Tax=thiotrophic endosymbiont of Bathymodiolus puteoserpentis (Logatchev) TaxID=343240 RepID=UPI0010B90B23|nr:Asp-tRNA(Asn)/Glu-tRNA(Gln) amidotransferase subunit GatC [thiotrophic endosymbiont of Bathymodiolus puteoserpentis (Logatchev)]CAC9427268.1 Aspartyl-tRNA(Asn) amidotransferase subunit C (EC 6.3.5.6) @ Glutamyl-tRNA(Gln) amidotransferase subunit C (EC 6.3.5.7) [uncultured Gammaproteobacteria bacterium]CAC9577822.1 Aspartyl-tRNA(Asn) amidotransferase subunit C (EC 6.3.5.6) @ Glutamyl-tRNA(Gln) amidotransferase subunit C (EC 6.3.5.7) [uncultured Gammaproteobacteria bacterium]CAC9590872.1 Aspart
MIDNTQLKQIAHLAKLSIDSNVFDATMQDLNNILTLAEQLGEIDTDDITPMAHPLHMTQRLREDKVTEEDWSKSFQSIAPKIGKQHYLVPTVIE